MGNRLGFHNLIQRIKLLEHHHLHELTPSSSVSKYFCQIHTQCPNFQRNITVSSVKLNLFNRKTKSTEMSAERKNFKDDQQQTDNLIVRDQTAGCIEDAAVVTLSKRAMKRLARAEKHKEYKRRKKEENLQMAQRDDVGYSIEDLQQSSYYFENGVRKVYPYPYVFATHAKGRWVGRKILDVLEKEFGYDQPDDLVKSFERGMIHVNGKQAKLGYILKNNDYISHRTHRHENPVTAAPIEVIENNEDLVVINKPSSIPCHPCGRYRYNSVSFILGKEMGLVNLRNIYRLDRLTSGVLILGKSPEKTKVLMDQMANRQLQKEYVCRVIGQFPEGTVKVDQPLKALSNKLRLQVVSPTGKSSQTTFTRISYNGKSSVVRCVPHTGRTHQIRVHLQYLGHPIINDAFYNSDAWGSSRGKNGIYEIPFDKVCENILADHNEKLWTGGDNPLYEQKLRQMKEKEQHNQSTSDDSNHVSVSSVHTNKAVKNKCAHVSTVPSTGETPTVPVTGETPTVPITGETPSVPITSETLTVPITGEKPCVLITGETPTVPITGETPTAPITGKTSTDIEYKQTVHHSHDENMCSQEGQNLSGLLNSQSASAHSEERTDSQVCSHYPGSAEPKQETVSAIDSGSSKYPGFEMSKWSVDPSCDLCKKQGIDPEEKQLVMFLHAIKYKGPDWEYETALPEWATDDWNKEEEFAL